MLRQRRSLSRPCHALESTWMDLECGGQSAHQFAICLTVHARKRRRVELRAPKKLHRGMRAMTAGVHPRHQPQDISATDIADHAHIENAVVWPRLGRHLHAAAVTRT